MKVPVLYIYSFCFPCWRERETEIVDPEKEKCYFLGCLECRQEFGHITYISPGINLYRLVSSSSHFDACVVEEDL